MMQSVVDLLEYEVLQGTVKVLKVRETPKRVIADAGVDGVELQGQGQI